MILQKLSLLHACALQAEHLVLEAPAPAASSAVRCSVLLHPAFLQAVVLPDFCRLLHLLQMEEDFDEGSAATAAAAAAAAATTAGLRACSELLQQCEEYAPLLKEQEFKDHEASPYSVDYEGQVPTS